MPEHIRHGWGQFAATRAGWAVPVSVTDAIWDAVGITTTRKEGAVMDNACEACHRSFWYPHEVVPPLPAEPPQL